MPTPLVITNSATLKLRWVNGTRSWLNVLGMRGSAPITVNQALADGLFTEIKARAETVALMTHLNTNTIFRAVLVRDINTANQAEFESAPGDMPGTGVGDLLPLNVAAVSTLRTAGAVRSFRGRVYFSGWTEGENDAGGRTSAAVNTAIVAFINGVISVLTARALTLAVLSRPRGAAVIPERTIAAKAGFATPVTTVLARNTKWESQRRRTGRT